MTVVQKGPLTLGDTDLLRQACYIDGEWVAADDGRTVDVTNPSTGELVGTVPLMGAAETKRAIEAAEAALPAWRAKSAKERYAVLMRWHDLMMQHQDDLARIMTAEQGKPFAESKGEVAYGASFIQWFAEEGKRIYGDTIPAPMGDRRFVVTKQPVGVCAAITPWNFPNAMIARKAGPALAVGCTMVVKPASATPFSALAMAELAERAGVPKGVLSVVTGSASAIGGEMTHSPIVRKVTFTGSTEIGKQLMQQSATTVKKVSMELGGNAPFIVFDDADVDAAVEGAIVSKFRNAGQTCVCANRILAQDGIYDEFVTKLSKAVAELTVADGFADGSQIGPLIDMAAVEKVEDHISDAVGQGARVLTGGNRHELGQSFFQPTVVADVTPAMKVAKEETFGPLAPVFRFQTEEEAVQMANDTEFGLAAYFFSRDIGRVWRVSEQLDYGIVASNTGLFANEVAPFGGIKESGVGREGSKYGVEDYLEVKFFCMAGM